MAVTVLIAYDARFRTMREMAQAVSEGVARVPEARAVFRAAPEGTTQELKEADALILGSPNYTGVSGALKQWLDEFGDAWEEGWLKGKVGAAFTTAWTRHSGVEVTLWQLLHWLMAGGMIVVGLPYTKAMDLSGSYYGATATGRVVTEEDKEQARALGERVARYAVRLKGFV